MKFDNFKLLATGLVAAALPLIHAAPNAGAYSVFESVPMVPEGYSELSTPVDPSRKLLLRIHLAQQNAGGLENRLLQISDPEHVSYGQHMSRLHVEEMLAPKDKSVKLVKDWLNSFDFMKNKDLTLEGQWIKINLEVAQVEEMLKTTYKFYQDNYSGNEDAASQKKAVLRTMEYSLPKALHKHIDMVQPTTMFGMRPLRSTVDRMFTASGAAIDTSKTFDAPAFNLTACNTTITPECLAHLYKFEGYTPKANSKLGVAGYLEEYAQFDDLDIFLKQFAEDKVGNNFTWESIHGGMLLLSCRREIQKTN